MPFVAETVTPRGQSMPPKDLEQFIELANIKLQRPLVDTSLLFDDAVRKPGKVISKTSHWVKACADIAATLPRPARAFLGSPNDVKSFVARYAMLKSAREVLSAIARHKWAVSGNAAEANTFEEYKRIRHVQTGVPMEIICSISMEVIVNEHGQVGLSKNLLLDTLSGIRADRIRSCAICGRIFWGSRVNSECCGEKCRKTYNQRNSRKARRAHRG